jgi:5-methylcytosine-specific restriction enzyme A
MRKIPAWVGSTDDAKIPLQVQMRILLRQGGRCAITGLRFTVGDAKRLDHIVPLADGGVHGETNLQWILDIEHKAKTAAEAEERAWVRRVAARHAGLERAKRNNWARRKEPKPPLEVAAGTPEISRRYQ